MHVKSSKSDAALKNLNSLCDVELILGLPCILLMLECVHALIKIAQNKDVFMCDFVEFVKLAQHELYQLYCGPYAKYEDLTFDEFNSIQALTNHTLLLSLFSDLNGGKDMYTLCFHLLTISTILPFHVDGGRKKQLVTKNVFNQAINKVKNESEGVARDLILKLECCFPQHAVMTALGVIYPQFWATNGLEVEENFHIHLNVLKATFCLPCKVSENGKLLCPLLSNQNLMCIPFFQGHHTT
jgi:hypothetical protein